MTPNDFRLSESEESAFERLAGDFGELKGTLLELIQGSIDAQVEDEHNEAHTFASVDLASGLTPEEFTNEFIRMDTTEGNE